MLSNRLNDSPVLRGEIMREVVISSGGTGQPQEIVIEPKTEVVEAYPSAGRYISKVMVNAVTSKIDPNILASNIKQGVTILGVEGNIATDKPTQTKSVDPSEEEQFVSADAGYELDGVSVGAISPKYVGSGVERLGGRTYYATSEDQIIPSGVYLTGDQIIKKADNDIKLEELVVEPTEEEQVKTPSDGVTGFSPVKVGAISSRYIGSAVERKGAEVYEISESDRVIPADTYLTGNQTIKGVKLDQKTATPSTEEQIITSDVNGLKTVIVKPIPSNWLDTTNEANIYKGEVE